MYHFFYILNSLTVTPCNSLLGLPGEKGRGCPGKRTGGLRWDRRLRRRLLLGIRALGPAPHEKGGHISRLGLHQHLEAGVQVNGPLVVRVNLSLLDDGGGGGRRGQDGNERRLFGKVADKSRIHDRLLPSVSTLRILSHNFDFTGGVYFSICPPAPPLFFSQNFVMK